MSTLKSERMQVVLDLSQREKQAATEVVAEYQQRVNEERERLEDLQNYYHDYEKKFCGIRNNIRASDIERERQFLIELKALQSRQCQQIERLESDLRQKLAEWQRCHLKHQSLDELVERFKQEENQQANKREQQMLDEWFSQTSNVSK